MRIKLYCEKMERHFPKSTAAAIITAGIWLAIIYIVKQTIDGMK